MISSITGDETRLDIRVRSLWVRSQEAFLDVRVFDPNTDRCLNATLPRCHEINEKEILITECYKLKMEHLHL